MSKKEDKRDNHMNCLHRNVKFVEWHTVKQFKKIEIREDVAKISFFPKTYFFEAKKIKQKIQI